MVKIEIYLKQLTDGSWIAGCFALEIQVEAGTPRQALVNFGNVLRRIKKEKVEELI